MYTDVCIEMRKGWLWLCGRHGVWLNGLSECAPNRGSLGGIVSGIPAVCHCLEYLEPVAPLEGYGR